MGRLFPNENAARLYRFRNTLETGPRPMRHWGQVCLSHFHPHPLPATTRRGGSMRQNNLSPMSHVPNVSFFGMTLLTGTRAGATVTAICWTSTKPLRRKVGVARAYRESGALRSGSRCGTLIGPSRAHRTGGLSVEPPSSRLRRVGMRELPGACRRLAKGTDGFGIGFSPRTQPRSGRESRWYRGLIGLVLGCMYQLGASLFLSPA